MNIDRRTKVSAYIIGACLFFGISVTLITSVALIINSKSNKATDAKNQEVHVSENNIETVAKEKIKKLQLENGVMTKYETPRSWSDFVIYERNDGVICYIEPTRSSSCVAKPQ